MHLILTEKEYDCTLILPMFVNPYGRAWELI